MRHSFPQYDHEMFDHIDTKRGEWIQVGELFPAIESDFMRQVDKLVLRKDGWGFYKEVWLV